MKYTIDSHGIQFTDDEYLPITQPEIDAALQRISAWVESIGVDPLSVDARQSIRERVVQQVERPESNEATG